MICLTPHPLSETAKNGQTPRALRSGQLADG
jgi:hypothetical protein